MSRNASPLKRKEQKEKKERNENDNNNNNKSKENLLIIHPFERTHNVPGKRKRK